MFPFVKLYHAGCGGDFFGPTGSFNSPGYPNKYPENRECIWYIRTSPGSSITLTINEFDVEFHPNCHYDVLEVRDDANVRYQQSSRFEYSIAAFPLVSY